MRKSNPSTMPTQPASLTNAQIEQAIASVREWLATEQSAQDLQNAYKQATEVLDDYYRGRGGSEHETASHSRLSCP